MSGISSWLRRWAVTAAVAAIFMTAIDLALLERKFAYLRGGFLADEQLRGTGDVLVFAILSVTSDLAVVALPVAGVLALGAWARLRALATAVLAFVTGLIPLLAWTFLFYELTRYLGADADLGLMYSLVGRDVGELLAVGASHLARPAAFGAMSTVAVVALTWLLHRRGHTRMPPPSAAGLLGALLVVAFGIAAATIVRAASDTYEYGLSRKASGWAIGRLVQRVTDLDRDGFGLLQRPADPALRDARVYPWALDRPGNGVDEDGVGGDLPSAAPAYSEPPAPSGAWRSTPTIVLVMLESVRADAIGARLDGRAVTPVIDAIAREGASAARAYSHNGFTYQSRHHLFAGSLANLRGNRTLVDDFKSHGYEVAYFSGQDETFGGPTLAVGFDRADVSFHAPFAPERRYTRFTTPGSLALPFSEIERRITTFLARRQPGRPLFLYVNFHDTHFPYHHDGIVPLVDRTRLAQHQITPDAAQPLRRMYLNTVANVDAAIGRVLDAVRSRAPGPLGVIVTSDHGESLFDDDAFLGHGFALTEAQTRVPFVVSGLPIRLEEPFGQDEVRDALWAALQSDRLADRPVIAPGQGKRVFQYIGSVEQPRQIGEQTDTGSAVVVDLRRNRIPTLSGPPLALVHRWERIRLAQDASTNRR